MPEKKQTTLRFDEFTKQLKRLYESRTMPLWPLPLEGESTSMDDAVAVSGLIKPELLAEHPLSAIAAAALDDIVAQAHAMDALRGRETAIQHARAIEETVAVVEFILKDPNRYNEFKWRWDNAKTLHGIRNRHFVLKQPFEEPTRNWFRTNETQLRTYLSLSGLPPKDEDKWKKTSNWLARITLEKIFVETGRSDAYSYESYEWANHSTHFSPLGESYFRFRVADELAYEDMMRRFAEERTHRLLAALMALARNPDKLRRANAEAVVRSIYRMFVTSPTAADGVAKRDGWSLVAAVLFEQPADWTRIEAAVLGKAPANPLLINV